jgi:hypothetical protein
MTRGSHILLEHLVYLGRVTVQFKMQFGSQNAILKPLDLILFSHTLKIGVFWNILWQSQDPILRALMGHVSWNQLGGIFLPLNIRLYDCWSSRRLCWPSRPCCCPMSGSQFRLKFWPYFWLDKKVFILRIIYNYFISFGTYIVGAWTNIIIPILGGSYQSSPNASPSSGLRPGQIEILCGPFLFYMIFEVTGGSWKDPFGPKQVP